MTHPSSRLAPPAPGPRAAELADRLAAEVRESLARGDLELPPLRQSVVALLEICNRPQFEVRDVVDVVHTDPALAGHLLRVANAASFGARQRIDSISEAVARIGARQLQGVAAGLMLKADMFKGSLRAGTRTRRMWRHSAVAAMFARDLGVLTRIEPRGGMLIGLLHDVGEPFVLKQVLDLEQETGVTFDDTVVDDVVLALHVTLGAEVVRAWGLPDRLVAAVQFHHEWEAAEDHRDVAMMAHLADALATWAVAPSVEGAQDVLVLPVVEALGLTAKDLGPLLRAHDQICEAAGQL